MSSEIVALMNYLAQQAVKFTTLLTAPAIYVPLDELRQRVAERKKPDAYGKIRQKVTKGQGKYMALLPVRFMVSILDGWDAFDRNII